MSTDHPDNAKHVLVIGADLVMPKLFYFSAKLRELGSGYTVYTHDVTPVSEAVADRFGVRMIVGPPHRKSISRMLLDIIQLTLRVRARDFLHADLYCDYHILACFSYLIILRLKGIPVVLWCRGELYDWADFVWWQRLFFRVAIRVAKLVILKERYMIATLTGAGLYCPQKMIEIHNSVPLPSWSRVAPMLESKLRLLFLNSFKAWRNVNFCIDVAVAMRKAGMTFSMRIVGDKPASPGQIEASKELRNKIVENRLVDSVTIHPFTDIPDDYFKSSDIFLLPADLIYCNYGLLEAMSYGLIPFVNSMDGDFARIVEDGISGYGQPLDATQWAATLQALDRDRTTASEMSKAAHLRIVNHFTVEQMFQAYAEGAGLLQCPTHQGTSAKWLGK